MTRSNLSLKYRRTKWAQIFCFEVLAGVLIAPMTGRAESGTSGGLLAAPPGVTAISGVIKNQDGQGIVGVMVSRNTVSTTTDSQGRYLLSGILPGSSALRIDATRVGPKHDRDFGYYEIPTVAKSARTTALRYTTWLTPIDHAYDVAFDSPTKSEVTVSNVNVPDLQLKIPAGTTVRDHFGQVVVALGVTRIAPTKTPFPIADPSHRALFYTIQPSAVCFYTATGAPARAQLILPNWSHDAPHARKLMIRFDPSAGGWQSYGYGTVSADGKQIVPDPNAVVSNLGSAGCSRTSDGRVLPSTFQ